MPSSTSSSSTSNATRALVGLIAALIVYLVAVEVATRAVFPKISQERQRIARDYATARELRARAPDGTDSILLIGNSLLLLGIDRQDLQRSLAPAHRVALLPLENTTYFDWYFGMRRLYEEGAQPATVVLSLNPRQLLSSSTNGEHFARLMMQATDLPQVVRAANLNMMARSNYFFANLSEWLGMRATLRNAILEKWLPDAPALVSHFIPRSPPAPPLDGQAVGIAVSRLQQLQELCAAHGSAFALLIPPAASPADPGPAVLAAARQAGIAVLMPYGPGEMRRDAFSDGFHLNSRGAALFTARTSLALKEALSQIRPPVNQRAGLDGLRADRARPTD